MIRDPTTPRRGKKYCSAQFCRCIESTYHCLLGLLAVSGMRNVSEALNLELRDFDWMEAFNVDHPGSTQNLEKLPPAPVPLHPTAKMVLSDCMSHCAMSFSLRPSHLGNLPFEDRGTFGRMVKLGGSSTAYLGKLAFEERRPARGPCLHDFRHRFAVETLLRWYRSGEDVTRRACQLFSTYLLWSMFTLQILTGI